MGGVAGSLAAGRHGNIGDEIRSGDAFGGGEVGFKVGQVVVGMDQKAVLVQGIQFVVSRGVLAGPAGDYIVVNDVLVHHAADGG